YLTEPERDHGQIITLETQTRDPNQNPGKRGQCGTDQQREVEDQRVSEWALGAQSAAQQRACERRTVCTYGHEPGVADRELARGAVDEIETNREDDVDTRE